MARVSLHAYWVIPLHHPLYALSVPCICIYTHTHTHIYIYVYICIYTHTHTYTYLWTRSSSNVRMLTSLPLYAKFTGRWQMASPYFRTLDTKSKCYQARPRCQNVLTSLSNALLLMRPGLTQTALSPSSSLHAHVGWVWMIDPSCMCMCMCMCMWLCICGCLHVHALVCLRVCLCPRALRSSCGQGHVYVCGCEVSKFFFRSSTVGVCIIVVPWKVSSLSPGMLVSLHWSFVLILKMIGEYFACPCAIL